MVPGRGDDALPRLPRSPHDRLDRQIVQLDAPLGTAEQEGQEALDTAREVVALHNLPVETVVRRAREAGEGIIAAARDHRADLIVMGIASRTERAHRWGRTAETLLHRSPTEVVFDKLPE